MGLLEKIQVNEQMQLKIIESIDDLYTGNVSVAVLVEDSEGFSQLLLVVGVLHLLRHHLEELFKVDGAVSVFVHLVDHILRQIVWSWDK